MTILLLILASISGQAAEECPILLELKTPNLNRLTQQSAQRYADCMSKPHLPLAGALSETTERCALARPARGPVKRATDWVTTIAANFPGCETHLTITRK